MAGTGRWEAGHSGLRGAYNRRVQQCVVHQFTGPAIRRPVIGTLPTNTSRSLRSSARELFRASLWRAAIDPDLLGSYAVSRAPIIAPTLKRGSGMTSRDRMLALLEIGDLDTADQTLRTEDQGAAAPGVAREVILDAVELLSSRSGRTDYESRRLFGNALRALRDYWADLGERLDGHRTRRALSLLIVRVEASLRAHRHAIRTLSAGLRAVDAHSCAVVTLTAPHPPTSRPIANLPATGPAV